MFLIILNRKKFTHTFPFKLILTNSKNHSNNLLNSLALLNEDSRVMCVRKKFGYECRARREKFYEWNVM